MIVNTSNNAIEVITKADTIDILLQAQSISVGSLNLSQVLTNGNDGGGLQIKNIADPTNSQDAVTLSYLNAHGGAITSVFGRTGIVTAQLGDYNTSLVIENTNLYFTQARAIASPLTGYVSGSGTVSPTDTILQAIQKLNGNISALITGVSSVSGTANQISASSTTGAITLSLPSNVIFPGTWQIGAINYSDTGILFSSQSSTNSYNQAILQNTSSGSTASTNFNVSNDQATATINFGELGINSSGFTGSGSLNQPGYVYLGAGSTDLVLATYGAKGIHFVINSGTTDAMSISSSQNFTFTQLAQSSSWSPGLTFNFGAHASHTASTEFIDVDLALNRNNQWLAGTVATQRQVYLRGVTLTGASATATFTSAYTLYIDPPLAGSNASITTPYAGYFGGKVQFTPSSTFASFNIGSVSSDPSTLTNADIWYNSSSNQFKARAGGSTFIIPNIQTANTQVAFSNGTNLTGSNQFVWGSNTLNIPHLAGDSGAPSIAAGTGAGTSPTVTIPTGNDLDGIISIVTGSGSPAATAIIATITFNLTFTAAPKVIIYPANRAARDLAIGAWPIVPANGQTNGVTTTTFVLESGTALATATTYLWAYHVIQ